MHRYTYKLADVDKWISKHEHETSCSCQRQCSESRSKNKSKISKTYEGVALICRFEDDDDIHTSDANYIAFSKR